MSGLQALLDEWRAELSRKALGMTEADACGVLGIETREGQQVWLMSFSENQETHMANKFLSLKAGETQSQTWWGTHLV